MKRLVILVTVSVAALALAQGGSAGPGGIGNLVLPPSVVRAEVVMMAGGTVHDYRVDRGRITSAAVGSVTLLERDGTTVTVPLASAVRVTVRGRRVRPALLARAVGRLATTIRDGDQPAVIVRVGV